MKLVCDQCHNSDVTKFDELGGGRFKCKYCGATFYAEVSQNSEVVNYINLANQKLLEMDFSNAEKYFNLAINSDHNNANAYWGKLLARYGIEYIREGNNFIPTCHRCQKTSILDDKDYKKSIELFAKKNKESKEDYQKKAEKLEEIRLKIISQVQNAQPYDVFICYKETDDITGNKTNDLKIARDIFDSLRNDKLDVFFSNVSLIEHAGENYEPYIYHALETSKVLLVLASKSEYINAVWTANEWTRFLEFAQRDKEENTVNRTIIPILIDDMTISELPEELKKGNIQVIECKKVGTRLTEIVKESVKNALNRATKTAKIEKTEIVRKVAKKGQRTSIKDNVLVLTNDDKEVNYSVEKELDVLISDIQSKSKKAKQGLQELKEKLEKQKIINGKVLAYDLVFKYKLTNLKQLSNIQKFDNQDIELIKKIIATSDRIFTVEFLDVLYSFLENKLTRKSYVYSEEEEKYYLEFFNIIASYENPGKRKNMINRVLTYSKTSYLFKIFESALNWLELDDNSYEEELKKLASFLLSRRKYHEAVNYSNRILNELNEGNVEARSILFLASKNSNSFDDFFSREQNYEKIDSYFEELKDILQYIPNDEGIYNQINVWNDSIYKSCQNINEEIFIHFYDRFLTFYQNQNLQRNQIQSMVNFAKGHNLCKLALHYCAFLLNNENSDHDARIYLNMMMYSLGVCKEESLNSLFVDIGDNIYYQKAMEKVERSSPLYSHMIQLRATQHAAAEKNRNRKKNFIKNKNKVNFGIISFSILILVSLFFLVVNVLNIFDVPFFFTITTKINHYLAELFKTITKGEGVYYSFVQETNFSVTVIIFALLFINCLTSLSSIKRDNKLRFINVFKIICYSLLFIGMSGLGYCLNKDIFINQGKYYYYGDGYYLELREIKSSSRTSIKEYAIVDYEGDRTVKELLVIDEFNGGKITKIDDLAFSYSKHLEKVSLGNNIEELGCSFYECKNLESVYFSNSVKKLEKGNGLFCASNFKIYTDYGEDAFSNIFGEDVYSSYENQILFDETNFLLETQSYLNFDYSINGLGDNKSIEIIACNQLSSDDTMIIPSTINGITVTKIHKKVFKNASHITELQIPESVKEVDLNILEGISSLKYLTCSAEFASSISKDSKLGLEEVYIIGNGDLSSYCFSNCSNLIKVEFSNDTGIIGEHAFESCTKLVSLKFQGDVSSFGDGILISCQNLEELKIPYIGKSKTSNDQSLSYLFTSSSNEGSYPTNLSSITIGDGKLYSNTFDGLDGLKNISFEGNVTIVDRNVFEDFKNLVNVEFVNDCEKWYSLSFTNTQVEQIKVGKLIGNYDNQLLNNITVDKQTNYTFKPFDIDGIKVTVTNGSTGEIIEFNENIELSPSVSYNVQYEAITYNISYYVDDIIQDEFASTYTYGIGKSLSEMPHPKKDGQVFIGWADQDGNLFEDGISKTQFGDLKLYAKYQEKISSTLQKTLALMSLSISHSSTSKDTSRTISFDVSEYYKYVELGYDVIFYASISQEKGDKVYVNAPQGHTSDYYITSKSIFKVVDEVNGTTYSSYTAPSVKTTVGANWFSGASNTKYADSFNVDVVGGGNLKSGKIKVTNTGSSSGALGDYGTAKIEFRSATVKIIIEVTNN